MKSLQSWELGVYTSQHPKPAAATQISLKQKLQFIQQKMTPTEQQQLVRIVDKIYNRLLTKY